MSLSNDVVSQFAKLMTDEKTSKETTVQGTVVVDASGKKHVKIDGTSQDTPIEQMPSLDVSTTNAEANDRVTVLIKDHNAIVTGNISSPAPTGAEIESINILVAKKVDTEVLDADLARIDELIANKAEIGELEVAKADIKDLKADKASIGQLEATKAEIDELVAKKIDADIVNAKFVEVDGKLTAANADIDNLNATKANVQDLNATNANIENLGTKYANIDFANIGEAAIKKIFADTGLIKDIIVANGTVTGELVGVTIKGDLIEGNTVKADKLVVLGEDGLYYKLNVNSLGETTASADPKYQNGLDGSVIIAKSITADRVAVTDLVAFGATIGGFHITDTSLYSGVKSSVNNTTRGVYQDRDGQFSVGDNNNYLKFFKDSDGVYKLVVAADEVIFGSGKKSIGSAIDEAVDGLKIGGRNLLRESNKEPTSFGKDCKCWSLYGEGICTYINNYNGTDFCAANAKGAWSGVACYLNSFLDEFEAGDTMTFSVNVDNAANSDARIYFYMMQFNDAGERVYESEILHAPITILPPKESLRVSYTWTLDQPAIDVINNGGTSRFTIQLATADEYDAYFYAPKLEKGNKPSDWQPAPEDFTADVTAEIQKLRDEIRMIVTDENGESKMIQTGDGWTFNISNIQSDIQTAADDIDDLSEKVSGVDQTIEGWRNTVDGWATASDYIKIGAYESEPCIELGEHNTDNKVLITNTRSMFKVGSDIPTKISNKGIETDNIEIDNDLIQRNNNANGYYVWKVRSNGNYGLQWKGENS